LIKWAAHLPFPQYTLSQAFQIAQKKLAQAEGRKQVIEALIGKSSS
jgi:hypothetical protein